MDFPGSVVSPTHLHTWTVGSGTHRYRLSGSTGTLGVSITWPSANLAVYTPVSIRYPYAVNRVFWINGSTGGANVDFGIYTTGGTRIYSTGSTAQSGTSVIQYLTPGTTFTLSPGSYLFALSCSGTTNTMWGCIPSFVDQMRLCGFQQQASAVPLPATATFASMANPAIPFCGVTRTTTGF